MSHLAPAPAAPTASPTAALRGPSAGTAGLGAMIRLVLRRNRVRLLVWFVVLVGMYEYIVTYYKATFTTQASLDDFAVLSASPGMRALTGLSPAASTMGGAVWTKGWMTVVLSLALGVVFLVTRNGRADEEAGRTELLRSRVLGVHALSLASWIVNGCLCLLIGAGLAAVSLGGLLDPAGAGASGSLVLGASVAGVGLVGMGIGAVAGQLALTSRGANALASSVVILLYVIRMAGDMGDGTLSWLSPIGWAQKMEPYAADRWWPFLLLVLTAALLLAVAWLLEGRRDLGMGLLPQRTGHAGAPARLADPLGLALRLERNPIIGWTIAIVLAALMLGSVVTSMTDLLDAAGGSTEALLRGTGVTALLSLLVTMMALLTLIFALQTTVILRGDEASGIIEPQLAGSLSRRRWALERLLIPAVWSAVLLGIGGYVIGAVYGAAIGDSSQAGRLAGAALAYWPAVMVVVGLAVALWGLVPRVATPIAWAVMAAMWFLTMFGEVFRLPDWFLGAMPLAATPYMPLEAMSWTPLVVMTLVAAGLVAVGVEAFSRRDIQAG